MGGSIAGRTHLIATPIFLGRIPQIIADQSHIAMHSVSFGVIYLRADGASRPSCDNKAFCKRGRARVLTALCVGLGGVMQSLTWSKLWRGEEGQDIAEYAVMLAVILVIVVGTVRLIGSQANTVFSNVASSIQ